jgi:hypothetical protein
MRGSPKAAGLAARLADLDEDNRRLRVTVDDLRCHRRMLLAAFDLVLPPSSAERLLPSRDEAATMGPRRRRSRVATGGFVM